MPTHTDSAIVEYNEDGSRTITTVETVYPLSKTQQVAGWAGLGLLCVAPFVPLFIEPVLDKLEDRKVARKEKKRLKAVK